MKKRRFIYLIILAILLIGLSACNKSESETKVEEDFGLKEFYLGDEKYLVEKWVRLPDLDTDENIGYCLYILQKSEGFIANIVGGQFSMPVRVIGKLVEGEITMEGGGVMPLDGNPDYATRLIFALSLPKGSELPKTGTFVHDSKGEQKIDLRDLEVSAEDSAEAGQIEEAASEVDETMVVAKKFLEALENCPNVSPEENKLGFGIDRIEKDGDDYFIYWTATNELLYRNPDNIPYIFSLISFYDPADYSRSYRGFEIKDGDIVRTLKVGESLSCDHVRVNFETDSKVVYMYFKGVEEPEEIYTLPLFYTLILDDNPRVVEEVPRAANGLFDQ